MVIARVPWPSGVEQTDWLKELTYTPPECSISSAPPPPPHLVFLVSIILAPPVTTTFLSPVLNLHLP